MVKKELHEVYLLRGFASLMVCLFHLILGNEDLFPSSNLLEKVFSSGYLGVEVFFMLSGYVICYSFPPNFSFRDLKTFFLKRITRIEPPYIISILLIIILNFVSHKITGLPNDFNFLTTVSHLAYINNFFPGTYLNVVYWTLGIEFQFYFLIAFLFPLLKRWQAVLLLSIFFILFSCIPVTNGIQVIVPFLSYFTLGILLFFYKIKKQLPLLLFVILSLTSCIQIFLFRGTAGLIAALITFFILLSWNYSNRIIRFFAMISYSLYLTHVPIGGKIINLGMRYTHSDFSKYFLVAFALSISIGFAFLFYKFVELPAIRLSKRVRYNASPKESLITNEFHPKELKNQLLTSPVIDAAK